MKTLLTLSVGLILVSSQANAIRVQMIPINLACRHRRGVNRNRMYAIR